MPVPSQALCFLGAWCVRLFVIAVSLGTFLSIAWAVLPDWMPPAVAWIGRWEVLWLLLHILAVPLIIFAIAVGKGVSKAIGALARRPREHASCNFKAGRWVVLLVLSFIPSIWLGGLYTNYVLKALAERAEPLIQAVERYEADHGTPPESLKALVPEYLPAVPTPGLLGAEGKKYYYSAGNPDAKLPGPQRVWSLGVSFPFGWDGYGIEYNSRQDYPPYRGHIGKWMRWSS